MFISCVLSGYRLANGAKRHIVTDIKVNLISLLPRYVKICCQNWMKATLSQDSRMQDDDLTRWKMNKSHE